MYDSTERMNEMNQIQYEFEEIFRKFNLPIEGISQNGGSLLGQAVSTVVRGPMRNRKLAHTDYFYSTSNKVLHLTTLKYLYSIINEKAFRLYNLLNSNDKNEYNYTIGMLKEFYSNQGQTEKEIHSTIQNVKGNSFILSCTAPEELKSKKLWNEYGDKGKGVCIEIEIFDDPISWEGFFLSKVKYGELNRWNEFISEIIALCEKYPNNRYNFQFDMIFCLHKSPEPAYIKEKEIRILGQRPQKHGFIFDSLIHTDIGKKNLPVQYLKVPIWTETKYKLSFQNELQWLDRRNPGYNFTEDDFTFFSTSLHD